MLQLIVRELDERDLPAAWPLVRGEAAVPDYAQWVSLARSVIAGGGRVLGVEAEDGVLHGVALYAPAAEVGAGRMLEVATLATFELSRRAPVRRALCEALVRLACEAGKGDAA